MTFTESHHPATRRARNRAHWDSSLDPANLGHETASAGAFARQVALFASADVRHALGHLEPLPDRLTLDLGGGLGLAAALLARRGARVVLCDLSSARLKEARRQLAALGLADRVEFVQAEAERLPFGPATLSRAFTKSVLIHTHQPVAAAELGRVLAADARAAFIEPLDANPLANTYRALLAPGEWRSITRYFTPHRLRRFGGQLVEGTPRRAHLRPFFFVGFLASAFQFLVPNPTLFLAAEGVLLALDRVLFRVFPSLESRAWMGALLIRPLLVPRRRRK